MRKYVSGLFLLCFCSFFGIEEERVIRDEGSSLLEYHSFLQEALRDQDWWSAIDYAGIISSYFPKSPFALETDFVVGEAYYKLGQLELANEHFTSYLNRTVSPKHFEEAIYYKYEIAEQFRNGAKKPLFGSHKLPKIVSAEEDSLKIYEDVATAFPHDEIGAKALLGKAEIQIKSEEYKPSLETLDLLIRRFPKHELAAQGFLEKSRVYLMQCQGRSLDPALLDLADMNLRKFHSAFPRELRLAEADKNFAQMEESFAEHLMETGRFFEKTHKFPASILYYSKVLEKYPRTNSAVLAQSKLHDLQDAEK